VNVVVACWPYRVMRSDIGLYELKHLRKVIIERMKGVLGRSEQKVVSLSPCFRGRLWGVKYCWNRCSSILAF
jgi:hypothetical protein